MLNHSTLALYIIESYSLEQVQAVLVLILDALHYLLLPSSQMYMFFFCASHYSASI